MTVATPAAWGRHAPPDLLPLLRMLGDLKRIRSAGHDGSIAARLFAAAWAGVAAGFSAVMRAGLAWKRSPSASRIDA